MPLTPLDSVSGSMQQIDKRQISGKTSLLTHYHVPGTHTQELGGQDLGLVRHLHKGKGFRSLCVANWGRVASWGNKAG